MEKGTIKNFRRGSRHQRTNQFIVELDNCNDKKTAYSLKGKSVSWSSSAGKKITGKVMDSHGDKGALRVRFDKGLPPEALGQKVFVQ